MSEQGRVQQIVIVGGGTAGWMTAAGLISLLGDTGLKVTLIESEAIGVVGVGEATLPHLRFFNQRLGIDEASFMAATRATAKLGIEFVGWNQRAGGGGDSYIHPFGEYGLANDGVPFHQFWRAAGGDGPICDYSFPVVAARAGKFAPPADDRRDVASTFRFAYQMDATLYAPFLRDHAEQRGVTRVEGRVVDVHSNGETNDIEHVGLEDGRTVAGDMFIDCSGFRGLLIEDRLQAGYDEWTRWLPCDRAIAAPCTHEGPLLPYTRATARAAGWQWRIPLQHRTGNGYVYASGFTDDQTAEDQLITSIEGELLGEPRPLRFVTGKRRRLWKNNCVAIGLSGGFLEPLESTSIYLIQQGITHLVEALPSGRISDVHKDEYDRVMDREFERIRDFLILHYHANDRHGESFWDELRAMALPDSLNEKIELFRDAGRIQLYDHGLFLEASWVAVFLGQGVLPRRSDPRTSFVAKRELTANLNRLRAVMTDAAAKMPSHADWIAANCPAPRDGLAA